MKQGSYALKGHTVCCRRVLRLSPLYLTTNIETSAKFKQQINSHMWSQKEIFTFLSQHFKLFRTPKSTDVPSPPPNPQADSDKILSLPIVNKSKKEMSLNIIFSCTCKFYLGDQVILEDNILAGSIHLSFTKSTWSLISSWGISHKADNFCFHQ